MVIQTASIGDVILATSLLEKLHQYDPGARIDMLVKKGCEGLFSDHPFLHTLYCWDKSAGKYRGLWRLLRQIRANAYDGVINPHRFMTSGILTAFSKAGIRSGFRENPLSVFFTHRVQHQIGGPEALHETARNQQLLAPWMAGPAASPALYPSPADIQAVVPYQTQPYITIAPCSLWFTKQFPAERWIEFIRRSPEGFRVYLTGSTADSAALENIRKACPERDVINLAGNLSLLQTAALMRGAAMNFTNDSAPLHLATATTSPLTAVFCSTVTQFGFGPLGDNSVVVETEESLPCRPCGLHGHQTCPEGHFKCATTIKIEKLIQRISNER